MMKKEFAYLKKHYGNHTAAAKALGISQRAYRYYRSNGLMPKSKEQYIKDHVTLLKIRAA